MQPVFQINLCTDKDTDNGEVWRQACPNSPCKNERQRSYRSICKWELTKKLRAKEFIGKRKGSTGRQRQKANGEKWGPRTIPRELNF